MTPLSRSVAVLFAIPGLLIFVACGPHTNREPAASAATESWTPPRTADGQPDMSGYWQITGISTVSLEKGVVDVGTHAGGQYYEPPPYSPEYGRDRSGPARAKSTRPMGIVDPADGKIPWQPWAAARKKEVADHIQEPEGKLEYVDPNARCLSAGVPRISYATP
jgi:hypothetical protein